jgi:Reverse transcriptase (RNA-dependent DNA polymerase)
LKQHDRIIAAVNKRYHKRQFKFGFEMPKTVKHALEIDKENGNTLWQEAIALEMEAVRIAFKILHGEDAVPPGYQYMECHMVFEIKIEGFRRKARLVAGGHMTETPAVMTYAMMVSRDTVRIALTIAALNDLEVKTSDIKNAYLTAPCEEKIYSTLGQEFGPDAGKKAIIVHVLYGLKSAGASFRRQISDCMRTLGYERCKADPDLWYKPMVHPDDKFEYYAYVLLFVDNCLEIHHDATSALTEIDNTFPRNRGRLETRICT